MLGVYLRNNVLTIGKREGIILPEDVDRQMEGYHLPIITLTVKLICLSYTPACHTTVPDRQKIYIQ